MIELRAAALEELGEAMGIINGAKRHLKEQALTLHGSCTKRLLT